MGLFSSTGKEFDKLINSLFKDIKKNFDITKLKRGNISLEHHYFKIMDDGDYYSYPTPKGDLIVGNSNKLFALYLDWELLYDSLLEINKMELVDFWIYSKINTPLKNHAANLPIFRHSL